MGRRRLGRETAFKALYAIDVTGKGLEDAVAAIDPEGKGDPEAIRFKEPKRFDTDFPYLLAMIHDSFMSRRNSLVVPGGKMGLAMEIILQPIIERLMGERKV